MALYHIELFFCQDIQTNSNIKDIAPTEWGNGNVLKLNSYGFVRSS